MVKGITTIMHQIVLMKDLIRGLEEANRTLSKRRREKKTQIRQGGSLTVRDAQDMVD
jgi:membrane protease subunit (stomatin/prohibitin family)